MIDISVEDNEDRSDHCGLFSSGLKTRGNSSQSWRQVQRWFQLLAACQAANVIGYSQEINFLLGKGFSTWFAHAHADSEQ